MQDKKGAFIGLCHWGLFLAAAKALVWILFSRIVWNDLVFSFSPATTCLGESPGQSDSRGAGSSAVCASAWSTHHHRHYALIPQPGIRSTSQISHRPPRSQVCVCVFTLNADTGCWEPMYVSAFAQLMCMGPAVHCDFSFCWMEFELMFCTASPVNISVGGSW